VSDVRCLDFYGAHSLAETDAVGRMGMV
jgi:hypothetical protein